MLSPPLHSLYPFFQSFPTRNSFKLDLFPELELEDEDGDDGNQK